MRAKKFLSGTIATVLATAMAVTPVFAAGSATGGALPSTQESTQEGDTTYVDTVIYQVTVPTDQALTFNLDPQGLLGYFVEEKDGSVDSATAGALTDYAGKIVGTGSVEVTNESSVPITVTAEYSLAATTTGGITVKSAKDSTWDDSSKMMLLEVAASQMSTASTGAVTLGSYRAAAVEAPTTSGAIAAITSASALSTTYSAFAIDSTDKKTPTKLVFGLDKAGYKFTYDAAATTSGPYGYERDESAALGDKNSTVLTLTGYVAKDADWKDQITTKVKLNCVYTFAAYKSLGDGNVTGNNLVIDQSKLEAMGGAPTETLSFAAGEVDQKIICENKDIDSVWVNVWAGKTLPNAVSIKNNPERCVINGNVITIPGSYVKSMTAGTYKITVVYTDKTRQVVDITVS